jgi:hypothetical protein
MLSPLRWLSKSVPTQSKSRVRKTARTTTPATGIQQIEVLEQLCLLSGVNVQADFLAFNATNGPIVVLDCITGDTNNDGIVNDTTPQFGGTVTIQRNPNNGTPANLLDIQVEILEGASSRGLTTFSTIFGGSFPATDSSYPLTQPFTLTTSALAVGTRNLTLRLDNGLMAARVDETDFSITIDTTTPTAPTGLDLQTGSDSGSSQTDNITNDTTPMFSVAGIEIGTQVELLRNGAVVNTVTAGATSVTLTDPGAPNGSHTYLARQTDNAENTSGNSNGVSVTIDTVVPATPGVPDLQAASDLGPSSIDNLTSDTSPTFDIGNTTSGVTVELLRNGGVVATGTGNGATLALMDSSAAGTFNYSSLQRDVAGNEATSATLSVTIDNTPPTAPGAPDLMVLSDSGVDDTDNLTNIVAPTFSATLITVGNRVDLLRDGSIVATILSAATSTVSLTDSVARADGSFTYTVLQTEGGGLSNVSGGLSVTFDTTAPATPTTPDLQSGSDSGRFNNDDNTNATSLIFDIGGAENGATLELLRGGTPVSSQSNVAPGTVALTETSSPESTNSYTARQTDQAGNTSGTSLALSVVVDRTAPAAPNAPDLADASDSAPATASNGSNSDDITNIIAPTINVTGVEVSASVDLLRDSVIVNTADPTVGTSVTSITDAAVPIGTRSLQLQQTDLAGNLSPASVALAPAFDTTAPVVAGLTLTNLDNQFPDSVLTIDVTLDTSPTIEFDLTEQLFVARNNAVFVELLRINTVGDPTVLDSDTITFVAAGSDADSTMSALSLDANSAGTGLLRFAVRATDAAGNVTTSSNLQVFLSVPGDDTANAPGTPIFTEFFDLSDFLDPTDALGRNQVWQMSFDKTTQTLWVNTELGTETFQFDPATGAIREFDLLSLDPTQPAGTNPHGIFFDFDSFLTPRVWVAHRTAGGSDANIQGSVAGARLSYYDLVEEEFVTFAFDTAGLGFDVEDLHAVVVDGTGTVWLAATHSNTIFEVRMNKLDPSDRQATVIPHVVPDELAADFTEDFVPHGIDVIVDERTGEQYVWLVAEGASGRVGLLRPGLNVDGSDAWVTWDVNDTFEGSRGTFLKVDNGETPGIPDDDRIVATFPVERESLNVDPDNPLEPSQNPGGSPALTVGIVQILDPGSAALNPDDLSDPGTITTYVLPQVAGGTGTLAAVNQPYLDREGIVYYIDRAGAIGRFSPDELTPEMIDPLTASRVIVTSSAAPTSTVLNPTVFSVGSAPGEVLLTVDVIQPTHPALAAFDTDNSGDLSLSEVAAGNPALANLDSNNDMIVSASELSLFEIDRSQLEGLDIYEIAGAATDRIPGQGRGPFRGTINAGTVVYGSIAQSDIISSSTFAETSRRRISTVTSDGGGRMAFQTIRNGSLVMTVRDDGALFDEQINLTREIVLRDGIDPATTAFNTLSINGDPSAVREADGSVHVFGKNKNNNVTIYQFDPIGGQWTTTEINTPAGSVLAGNPVAFNDGDRGPAALATTSAGQLILFRPDGTTTDLTALATDPLAARVYGNAGIVDDVNGGRIFAYAADMAGNVVEYRFDRTGNVTSTLAADTLAVTDANRATGQVLRDTRVLQDVDVVLSGGTRHVFGTDGHSRLVHLTVSGDAVVSLAENVSQLIADTTVASDGSIVDPSSNNRVKGYFAFQMPFVARVYSEVAPVVEADGSLTVFGTNGGDLVRFTEQAGVWSVANLSKDADPSDDASVFTPANFVFGASAAYTDNNGDGRALQINGKGEVVEYIFDRSATDPSQNKFSTQNINLARSNNTVALSSLATPALNNGAVGETIIDNLGPGYSNFGVTTQSFASGFNGDQDIVGGLNGPQDGTSIAQWDFTELAPGEYRVSATWTANANNASNSTFVVMADGSTGGRNRPAQAGQIRLNQERTPGDFSTADGTLWQDLMTSVRVDNGTLTVMLSDAANGQVIADAIRIERVGTPLLAAGGAAVATDLTSRSMTPSLTSEDVDTVLQQAIAIVTESANLTSEQTAILAAISPVVVDLPGAVLADVSGGQVYIDQDAAGHGWYIESTPTATETFEPGSTEGELIALPNTLASDRIDLLTVLLHEIGHVLGEEHNDERGALLNAELASGTRRLPVLESIATDRLAVAEPSSNDAGFDEQFFPAGDIFDTLNQL